MFRSSSSLATITALTKNLVREYFVKPFSMSHLTRSIETAGSSRSAGTVREAGRQFGKGFTTPVAWADANATRPPRDPGVSVAKYLRMLPHPINLALTVSCNTGYVKTSERSKTGHAGQLNRYADLPVVH